MLPVTNIAVQRQQLPVSVHPHLWLNSGLGFSVLFSCGGSVDPLVQPFCAFQLPTSLLLWAVLLLLGRFSSDVHVTEQ